MTIGPITAKRAIKRAAGWAAVLASPWVHRPAWPRACLLMYHRVAPVDFVDPRVDDWNVPPSVFSSRPNPPTTVPRTVPATQPPKGKGNGEGNGNRD